MTTLPNSSDPILCKCGCGQKTILATRNRKELGWVKGEPLSFIKGHNRLFKRGPKTLQGEKWCGKCETVKKTSDFSNNKNESDGKQGHCKECKNIVDTIWRNKNRKQSNRITSDSRRKKKLGVSSEDYEKLLESHDNVCAICKKTCVSKTPLGLQKSLCVDHDHVTGAIRGLLCSKCNTGLGLFNDDIKLLLSARNYLLKTDSYEP